MVVYLFFYNLLILGGYLDVSALNQPECLDVHASSNVK